MNYNIIMNALGYDIIYSHYQMGAYNIIISISALLRTIVKGKPEDAGIDGDC